ncbi:cupin domain-containing protein [Ruegeria atlantica]|uniref:cupin domain-containing protein n=1 Tax=Ruegeria atlantica TaxID=81569 RepID=UPI00147C89C4|nr:cupin domain-containing protein [Ruegeria atlantica]
MTKYLAAAAAQAFAIGLFTTAAMAGSCPEDKILSEARDLKQAPTIAVGRQVLGEVDLTGWRDMGNFKLRTRRLIIDVNGVVPTHNHGDRPSIVYILQGEIYEHNAYCAEPILHKTGDVAVESGPGHIHWWENTSDEPVVVLSSDVIPFNGNQSDDM